jgi:hypothetical protein
LVVNIENYLVTDADFTDDPFRAEGKFAILLAKGPNLSDLNQLRYTDHAIK